MLQHILPASGLLFTLENILWINIGVFIGSVFAAIPGLSVILCVIVPLVIAGGPFRGGAAVEELVSTESLPKTILALAGVDVGDAMIGENLLDVVEKKDDNRPNQVFAQISESRVGRCIRTPDYLYSVYAPGVNGGEAAASDTYADDFLYDMKEDPWQLDNRVSAPAYAQVKADLRARLLDWLERAEGTRPIITE